MDASGHDAPFGADPYRDDRGLGHAVVDAGFGPLKVVVGYDDVRAACRDWHTFSSDAPFEVPIPFEHDVRSVRQLPIETDPPDHTDYRALVAERFSRSSCERYAPAVREVADEVLTRFLVEGSPLDVVDDLALPVVNVGLAAALGRPRSDAERWLEWGVHVFRSSGRGPRVPNPDLDAYLRGRIDEALRSPGDDLFGELAAADFRGRRLTADEIMGFANLMFAGGRDTVVTAIVSILVWFALHRDDWARVQADPALVPTAVEELLRINTPLAFIGRHVTNPARCAGADLGSGEVIAVGFAAANRDPRAFADADRCRIDRRPNRHVAFGHGPHTCLGAHLARMELRVVLARLVALVGAIDLVGDATPTTVLTTRGRRPYGVDRAVVRLAR